MDNGITELCLTEIVNNTKREIVIELEEYYYILISKYGNEMNYVMSKEDFITALTNIYKKLSSYKKYNTSVWNNISMDDKRFAYSVALQRYNQVYDNLELIDKNIFMKHVHDVLSLDLDTLFREDDLDDVIACIYKEKKPNTKLSEES